MHIAICIHGFFALLSRKKTARALFINRLFPNVTNGPLSKKIGQRIHIHAPSLGEMKLALFFAQKIRNSSPEADFLFTYHTHTAKKLVEESDLSEFHMFMPFDSFRNAKRLLSYFSPDQLIYVEGDVWPALSTVYKKNNVKTVIINAKMSQRSFQRFKNFTKVATWLFSTIDVIIAQSACNQERYSAFVDKAKLSHIPNLKFEMDLTTFEKKLLKKVPNTLLIASTHENEEIPLLQSLPNLLKDKWKIFIAPRHPERFKRALGALKRKGYNASLASENKNTQVVLIDSIGELGGYYSQSQISIIGGSFEKVGGHNLFEPLKYSSFPIFGPFTFNQKESARVILKSNCGMQSSLVKIEKDVLQIKLSLLNEKALNDFSKRIINLKSTYEGSVEKTLRIINL